MGFGDFVSSLLPAAGTAVGTAIGGPVGGVIGGGAGTFLGQATGGGSSGGGQVAANLPTTPSVNGVTGQASAPPIQGQALWKPVSESDGNLVMLFPYVAGTVTIKDAETGQILDTGRSSGPSNGFADTIRFTRPGAAYKNVIVEDQFGNQIPIEDGSQRIEGIQVSGFGFPVLPALVPPALPGFTPIEETPMPKRKKGPKLKLAPSSFRSAPAPVSERREVASKSVSDFAKEFKDKRS